MNFLTPLFLLGGLAIAAPIVYHLIRHITRQKLEFSSLIFLEPSPPQITRRSRLQDILLLLLRCLVLALLALAFARPYLQKSIQLPTVQSSSKRVVVLVDTSASMRRSGLWDAAVKQAADIIGNAAPADEVAALTFDRTSTTLLRLEDSRALAPNERRVRIEQALADVKPSWNTTHYGMAVGLALEMLHEAAINNADSEQLIYLVSDMQEGARVDGLQGLDWPKNARLVLTPVETTSSNAGLLLVGHSATGANESGPRVRVVNAADSKKEQFKIGWVRPGTLNYIGTPADVYVAPGKSQTLLAPARPKEEGALALLLTGDDHVFDNQLFIAASGAQVVKAVYYGKEQPADSTQPLYYLQRALQETTRQRVEVIPGKGEPSELLQADLIVVGEALSDAVARMVATAVAGGKTALVAVRTPEMQGTLATILPDAGVQIGEGRGREALLSFIDFEHPLFAPFADPRFSDFSKIRFWKRREIRTSAPDALRTLAKFDDDTPALLHGAVGKGSAFVLASGWHPVDSQLALSSKFVPLLYGILDYAGAIRTEAVDIRIGEPLPLPRGRAEVTLRKPVGEPVVIKGETAFNGTMQPGIYVIEGTPPQQFAVNVDPAESKTQVRATEDFEKLGAPLKAEVAARIPDPKSERNLLAAELESRQKLWRWFLAGAVLFILMESALSAVKTWRRTEAQAAA